MSSNFALRLLAAALLTLAGSSCSDTGAPPAIVSLSAQTTAVVQHLGSASQMTGPDHAQRDPAGNLESFLRHWLRSNRNGTLRIIGLEKDAPELSAALVADPRIRLELYRACTIVEVFAMYRQIGETLSKPAAAAERIRSISTELGRVSGSTLGLARPRVVVASSNHSAFSGIGLMGDMIEIGGGEHLLEAAGPPCSSFDYTGWTGIAPQVVIDARRDTTSALSQRFFERPRPGVSRAPGLLCRLEHLQLAEAARQMRAALFPDTGPFQMAVQPIGDDGEPSCY